jgi:hypothetical protein
MLGQQLLDLPKIRATEAKILRQLDFGLYPVLRFAVCRSDMDVATWM